MDLLRRQVTIADTVVDVGGQLHFGPPKTRAGRRTVPLPRVAAEPLGEHLATYARGPEDLVFTAPEGGPVSLNVWRRRFWAPATKASGIGHLRPHDLRHTAVALWIAAGAHPKEVAVRAGHTSVSFTLDRYGHLFPGSEEVLNDSLDTLASQGRAESAGADSDAPCAIVRDFFAHVARTPEDRDESVSDVQASDQDEFGGRCGTRTHDLSRVKAAL